MIKKFIFLAVLAFFILGIPLFTLGATFKNGDNVTVSEDEVIDGDMYIAGSNLNIKGFIKGDLFSAGGTVDVEEDVGGDLFVAGGMINIRSSIWDDAKIAGGQIDLDSDIGDDLFVAGSQIECTKDSAVGGDAFMAGGVVRALGDITGDLRIAGGEVVIGGDIGGKVTVEAKKLTLQEGVTITGDFEYTIAEDLVKEAGVTITGETIHNEYQNKDSWWMGGLALTGIFFLWKFIWWLALLAFLLVMLWIFPRYSVGVTEYLNKNPWRSLGIGLLTLILTPIVALVLCVLVVGLPLGLTLAAFYGVLIFVSKALLGLWAGRMIFKLFNKDKKGYKAPLVWSAIIGTLVVAIVFLIPVIGFLAKMIAIWFMFGAVVLYKWKLIKDLRQKKLI